MGQFKSTEVEREAMRMAAFMMASSARTAPKARGLEAVKTMVIDGDDIELLAGAMEAKAKEQLPHLAPAFIRDASNIRKSGCVLLLGVTGKPKKIEQPLDCGACGYETCKQLLSVGNRPGRDFYGPNCIIQALDLGIALGSAVKLASELNVDNRIMWTAGAAARKLGLLDTNIVIAIPLSATGKSIYFDRK